MRKANRKLKKPTFLKDIGPISNSFSLSNTREQRLFFEKLFHVRLKCRLLVRK